MTLPVTIAGARGRMGSTLVDLVSASPTLSVAGATLGPQEVAPTQSAVAAELYTHDLADALSGSQVFIDFTTPDTIAAHARACAAADVGWVLGTTGLDTAQQEAVQSAAQHIPICQAANFSTGVNLMLRLVELAAGAVDEDTDLEVMEAHHRHKVDAPSGTALAIGEAMARARGVTLDEHAVMSRQGITGPRPEGAIGFATVRAGDIVGEHTALFASDGERLEITHRAGTREAFARGACRAALWLEGRAPGLYDMQDVLGLREEGNK
ncbi:MAG: 4-hydroxy-tetrahydrodipicolinate reductase [Halieaceae bacterium]